MTLSFSMDQIITYFLWLQYCQIINSMQELVFFNQIINAYYHIDCYFTLNAHYLQSRILLPLFYLIFFEDSNQRFEPAYNSDQNKINNFLQLMNNLSSPFMESIRECKQSMRKLRKKIYKHSVSAKGKGKKPKDSTEEILSIFRHRKVPQFVTETLLKRRNFDISSIKNIAITFQLPLHDIQNRTDQQENEANQLYSSHKERMTEIRSKVLQLKTEKSLALNMHPPGVYSSTEEQAVYSSEFNVRENEIQIEEEQECYENFSSESKEQVFSDNYFHLNNMESSLNSDLALFNF